MPNSWAPSFPELLKGNQELLNTKNGPRWKQMLEDGKGGEVFVEIVGLANTDIAALVKLNSEPIRRSVWGEIVDTVERHNEPGKFTAFIGWEWSSVPDGRNLHRIIFTPDGRDKAMQYLPYRHLAIRPYPKILEERITFNGDEILLRPIRPEDEPAHREFFSRLRPEDVRFRFFGQVRKLLHSQLARYTQIDYDREMAIIATRSDADRVQETLGVARAVSDPDNDTAEFAIIVRSDLKGMGLGRILTEKLVRYCAEKGTRTLVGEVLGSNQKMLALAHRFGFDVSAARRGTHQVRMNLLVFREALSNASP